MPAYESTSVAVRCPACEVTVLAERRFAYIATHLRVPEHGDIREAALHRCVGSHAILHLVNLQPVRQAWDAYERCGTGRGMVTLS